MRGTWDTGLKPFGVPLKVNWTFLLWPMILWSFGWWMGLQVLLMLTVSLLIHEYTHVLAARSVGSDALDVTVYILGGAARIPNMISMSPGEEAYVAAMGPISSFALAGLAFLATTLLGSSTPWIVGYAVLINIVLGVFNLLPLYPMDGGRILRAILAHFMGRARGTKAAVWTTAIFGGMLGIASLLFGQWTIAIIMALMILVAFGEQRMTKDKAALEALCARYERMTGRKASLEIVDGEWQIRLQEKDEAP